LASIPKVLSDRGGIASRAFAAPSFSLSNFSNQHSCWKSDNGFNSAPVGHLKEESTHVVRSLHDSIEEK
jgi:hypothetical protein